MSMITQRLALQHQECDELCADAEAAVGAGRWEEARGHLQQFCRELHAHLDQEESVLFPELELHMGTSQGPTAVMRMEHEQMRALAAAMQEALAGQDGERYLGCSASMMLLMQQHNMKEEGILYPMAERVIPEDSPVRESLAGAAQTCGCGGGGCRG